MKHLLIVLFIVTCLGFSAGSQQNFVVQPGSIPAVTHRQLSDWIVTQRSLLGIRAFDPGNARMRMDYRLAAWYYTAPGPSRQFLEASG